MTQPPILTDKHCDQLSVFSADNLLREARRQKSLPKGTIPAICILDPDGDIVRQLQAENRATASPVWACYHTTLYEFEQNGITFGIIGCAVGASFAVLLAEELFACGCQLLISVTSAGQIAPGLELPCFVLIEKALRDEGTSYHYLPPSDYCNVQKVLLEKIKNAFDNSSILVTTGSTWTTDAPFRETKVAIQRAKERGISAVEMEAAALYAFSQVTQNAVICFAHVTNQMAQIEGDFEKGEADGSKDALRVIELTAKAWSG